MASRYKSKLPSNWVISHVELSVPTPRARGGASDVGMPHAQIHTEAVALPSNSSALVSSAPEEITATVSHSQKLPSLTHQQQAVNRPTQARARYSNKYVPTWTLEQEKPERLVTDTMEAQSINHEGAQNDGGWSSSKDKRLPHLPEHGDPPAQHQSIWDPPFHIGEPAIGIGSAAGEDPADRLETVQTIRRSQHPLAVHSRMSAAQRQAGPQRRNNNRYQVTPDSVSSVQSTTSPQSRGEASAGAPSISPCYST